MAGSKRGVGRRFRNVRTAVPMEFVLHHPKKKHRCGIMLLHPICAV
jgi:hypothetical protein